MKFNPGLWCQIEEIKILINNNSFLRERIVPTTVEVQSHSCVSASGRKIYWSSNPPLKVPKWIYHSQYLVPKKIIENKKIYRLNIDTDYLYSKLINYKVIYENVAEEKINLEMSSGQKLRPFIIKHLRRIYVAVVAQGHERLWTWRLCVHSSTREMKYLIFSSPRSGNEAKRGVEFRHSTHNASIIRR